MEWVSHAERHRGYSIYRRIHAAPARWSLPFSSSGRDGIPLRLGGDPVSGSAGPWLRHPFCRARIAVHDSDRRTHRARWLANPYYLGGDSTRDHGLWTRPNLNRSSGAPFPSAARDYSIELPAKPKSKAARSNRSADGNPPANAIMPGRVDTSRIRRMADSLAPAIRAARLADWSYYIL